MTPLELPVPPAAATPEEMHRWMLSMYNWLKNMFLSGNQMPHLTAQQLTDMQTANQQFQSGKIFYDHDNNAFKGGVLVGGNLSIKTFTVT